MTKQGVPRKTALTQEDSFSSLMVLAAGFSASCGGFDKAKESLLSASTFIDQAGGVEKASHALKVLEILKVKIETPVPSSESPAPSMPSPEASP